LVEFALGLPILLLIIIGVVEIGRAVLAYTVVGNIAREGARYAIMTTAMDPQTWQQTCNFGSGSSIVYSLGDFVTCDGSPNIVSSIVSKSPGLDLARLTITVSHSSTSGTLEGFNRSVPVTVRVDYTHPILFGQFLRLSSPFDSLSLSSASTMFTQ
jgi:hypothetical protein